MTAWFDSDHARNIVTRQLQTEYLIFVNQAPILWCSKYQHTLEASTCDTEFIAGHTYLEAVEGLQFKLRMFGIPINWLTCEICDDNIVVKIVLSIQSQH
eukprot:13313084-Ditylum_brightwellii.AAC.1